MTMTIGFLYPHEFHTNIKSVGNFAARKFDIHVV